MDPRLRDLAKLVRLVRDQEETRLGRIVSNREKIETDIERLRTALPDPDPTQGFTRLGGWERARLWHDREIMLCNEKLTQLRQDQKKQAPKTARARARYEVLQSMIRKMR